MKTWVIILIIVVVLAFGTYKYGMKAVDKVTFGQPQFVNADFKSLISGSGVTSVNLSETITNANNFSIPVTGLYFEVYYNGITIARSQAPHVRFVIPANGSLAVTETVLIDVQNSIQVGLNILSGQSIKFDYMVRGYLFGFFPFTYKGTFTY